MQPLRPRFKSMCVFVPKYGICHAFYIGIFYPYPPWFWWLHHVRYSRKVLGYLIGGLEHVFFPHNIWDVILPIDEPIIFRGVGLNDQPVILINIYSYT